MTERGETVCNQIYKAPNLGIVEVSGSIGSALHVHPEIPISVLSDRGSLQVDWLTETGQMQRTRFQGPGVCVTPVSQPHAMRWQDTANSFVFGVSPDLTENETGSNGLHEVYGVADPFICHLVELLSEARLLGASLTRLLAESTTVIMLQRLRRIAERAKRAEETVAADSRRAPCSGNRIYNRESRE